MFSQRETEYLRSQRLARIATISTDGQPDVAPVIFEFDGKCFLIGGIQQERTLKYKNVAEDNTRVSLVVDDLESVEPWLPRGIKLHGSAEIVERESVLGRALVLKITPDHYWSWGIDEPAFSHGKPLIKRGS